jgi:hypothetical protein
MVETAMPNEKDDTADKIAASVSRYFKQASAIVAAVGLGKFPT